MTFVDEVLEREGEVDFAQFMKIVAHAAWILAEDAKSAPPAPVEDADLRDEMSLIAKMRSQPAAKGETR